MDKQQQLPSFETVFTTPNSGTTTKPAARPSTEMDWQPTSPHDYQLPDTTSPSQPLSKKQKAVRFASDVEVYEVPRWDKMSEDYLANKERRAAMKREREQARLALLPTSTNIFIDQPTKPLTAGAKRCGQCGMEKKDASPSDGVPQGAVGALCRCAEGGRP